MYVRSKNRSILSYAIFIVSFSGMIFIMTQSANAKIRTASIEYKQADTVCEGYLAYEDSIKGKRPGILIIHQWMGLQPYEKMRAEQIAGLGYVAFALDVYGKGIRPKNASEAAKQAAIYRSDRKLMRARAQAGLDTLRKQQNVDPAKVAVMGYCFGGGVALELGLSGADLTGIVVFHGNLDTPAPEDAKNIKGRVLVLHGGDDPYTTPEGFIAFEDELRKGHVDWQIVIYGGAVHAFTDPSAGNDPSRGAAYNKRADELSFDEMKRFYNNIFSKM
jgi:dienelactone hydrolase